MDSKWTDAGKVLNLKVDILALGLNNVSSGAPSNPEEGEPWYDSTNHFIRWYDGTGWNAICVYIGTAAPGTPVEGLIWYDTTNNLLKSYDGSAWVLYALHIGTAAPGVPTEGHMWYDTTNHVVRWYDGSGWNAMAVYYGTAAPDSPDEGLLWYDTDANLLKSYDGSAWVLYAQHIGTAAPSVPIEGHLWYDTDNNLFKTYNGSTWDTHSIMANSDIGQAELKTDTEEETADQDDNTGFVYQFTSALTYGFYPQVKFEANTDNVNVQIYYDVSNATASYITSIYIFHNSGSARNVYAQMRYVTASGEICWIFILQDKITKKYIRMHKSPDHPAIGCHDVEAVHHPFHKAYDPEKHNMFCIPLAKAERAEVEDLREWKNELPQLTFLQTVKKYYDIDENPKDAKWPDIPVTIGLDRKRKPMKAKIPKRDYIKQAALIKKV